MTTTRPAPAARHAHAVHAPGPSSAGAAAELAIQAAAPAEFSGWYLSSFELREGLTVIHLDELPPQAMFA
jgi:hypothetical protein